MKAGKVSGSVNEVLILAVAAIAFILLLPYLFKMLIKSTTDQAGELIGDAAKGVSDYMGAPAAEAAVSAQNMGYNRISPVTGIEYTKVYDYPGQLASLAPIPAALVNLGEWEGALIGVSTIETGAELRYEFEDKMSAAGQIEEFNALPDVGRLAVRTGEGLSNLIGFSPYAAGVATRAWWDDLTGGGK